METFRLNSLWKPGNNGQLSMKFVFHFKPSNLRNTYGRRPKTTFAVTLQNDLKGLFNTDVKFNANEDVEKLHNNANDRQTWRELFQTIREMTKSSKILCLHNQTMIGHSCELGK